MVGALERGGVVALGGGAIESDVIRAALGGHVTVWCQISEEMAWARCSGSDRPLARNREGFRGRFRARAPLYEEAADALLPVDADVDAAAPWIAALRTEPGHLADLGPRFVGSVPGSRRDRGDQVQTASAA